LGVVGGEQRRTQDTVNLVEWVIGDADERMTGHRLVN